MNIKVPGSKSMTQRALIIAALSECPVEIKGALMCDDSRHLTGVLRTLGAGVEWNGDCVSVIPGRLRGTDKVLFCGNAGTAMRFSSCLSLVCDGAFTLDGDERMRERPIGPLGKTLESLGVSVRYLAKQGFPPLRLERTAPTPRSADVDSSISSQFASGLLMISPCFKDGLTVGFGGRAVSAPYIRMTTAMMEKAGAKIAWKGDAGVEVKPGKYRPEGKVIVVEPDWSAAAFVMAASFVSGKNIMVDGMASPENSLQGDSKFFDFMEAIKSGSGNDFDLTDTPDLIAPLAAAGLFASKPVTIRGAAHTRVKESDRIAVLCGALRKIGAVVGEFPDGMRIEQLKQPSLGRIVLDPFNDHRMAMTFGIISLKVPGIEVLNKGCVSKSYPNFWEDLEKMRKDQK